MNIIFTSESTGKASLNVRRVLDRFATRIGSDAWEASLTLEGLGTVKALLNRASSRKSSVACHRITQDGARVLVWSVGNTRMFNHDGACSTGWTAKRLKREDVNLAYPVRLVTRLVSIAGLLHDIGKTTSAFQGVLSNSGKLESFRHEAVSAMMLAWLAGHGNDLGWINVFILVAESGGLDGEIRAALKGQVVKHRFVEGSPLSPAFLGASATDCRETPVLFGLMWLITAHHRLPGGSSSVSQCFATVDDSVHARKASENLVPVDTLVKDGLPWKNDAWLARLTDDLKALLVLVDDPQFVAERDALFDHLRLFGRPAFQLADHLVSSKSTVDSGQVPGYAYANSVELENGERQRGQRLYRHLLDVSRRAASVVQEVLCMRESMPGVDAEDIPPLLRKKSADVRFSWQDGAAQAIRSSRTDLQKNAFFGVVIAGTGTGKTIGSLKLAAAFKDSLRVVYASPLRSLTLQSGHEFSQLGFGQDDLATVIGEPLIQKIFEAGKGDFNSALKFDDNEFDKEAINVSGGFSPGDLKENLRILDCLDDRGMKMVATPILAATLDTVMKLADGRRGSYLSHLLRIASSDLIIDEVDMFSPSDLIAIGRLVESAGFWKSRLFLCSATLSPVISTAFYHAYMAGLASRNLLEGTDTKMTVGWFSDLSSPVVRSISSDSQFGQVHQEFVSSFVGSVAKKRLVAGYILRRKKQEGKFDILSIIASASHLHGNTGVTMGDGRRFSFGCIQVVNVKNCQKITMALCNQVDLAKARFDVDVRVVCLHGRLSLATRTAIDGHLNRMLCRKGPHGDLAPLENPYVRDFVAQSTAKNVVVILVSTMETTGRDHDFDWGIIESRQERDIIQFAGRIRRHRIALEGEGLKNLIIFSAPLSWDGTPLEKTGIHPFSFFGVTDTIGSAKVSGIASVPLRRKAYDADGYGHLPSYPEMMELTYGLKKPYITPERVLSDFEMNKDESTGNVAHTVRACETGCLRNALLAADTSKDKAESLTDWLGVRNQAGRLLNRHQNTYRFRSSQPMEYYWRDSDDIWYFVSVPGREYDRQFSLKQEKILEFSETEFKKDGLLFQIDEEEEIAEIQTKTQSFGFKSRVRLSGVNTYKPLSVNMSKIQYHCQLGLMIDGEND